MKLRIFYQGKRSEDCRLHVSCGNERDSHFEYFGSWAWDFRPPIIGQLMKLELNRAQVVIVIVGKRTATSRIQFNDTTKVPPRIHPISPRTKNPFR